MTKFNPGDIVVGNWLRGNEAMVIEQVDGRLHLVIVDRFLAKAEPLGRSWTINGDYANKSNLRVIGNCPDLLKRIDASDAAAALIGENGRTLFMDRLFPDFPRYAYAETPMALRREKIIQAHYKGVSA